MNRDCNNDEHLAAIVMQFATRDGDSQLTRAELPEASADAIGRIDRNGDGLILGGVAVPLAGGGHDMNRAGIPGGGLL